MNMEQWAVAPSLGPDYRVSSFGNVRRETPGPGVKNLGHNLYQGAEKSGHRYVVIRAKAHKVHRLVLEAFVGPAPEGYVACHNDGDPSNNRLENLRWDTRSNNQLDMNRHGTSPQSKTHCKNGHEFNAENTRIRISEKGRERRDCIPCSRLRASAQKAKARAHRAIQEKAKSKL